MEDDPQVRALLTDLLGELGYAVHDAGSADEALPLLQSRERLDLLVSDVGLPGLNGRQLAEIARRSRPELPVLFLTGYTAKAADRSSFLEPGMDLLTKPFDLQVLADKVRSILSGRID